MSNPDLLNWKLTLPKYLTEEEKMLRSKYEMLRKLKQRLSEQKGHSKGKAVQRRSGDQSHKIKEGPKKAAVQILMAKGGLSDKKNPETRTQSFKKPSSQCREIQIGLKRSAQREYFPETDCQTRSVAVKGRNLTQQLLKRVFSTAGDIWNIRNSENGDSAVVTFTTPESACKAVKMDGVTVDRGQRLSVSHTKKKNQSWKEIIAEDRKTSVDNHLLQKKRTVYVSYNGLMTATDLRGLFHGIGLIETVYMSKLKNEEKSGMQQKSYAFVTFSVKDDAEKAVRDFNGTFWKGMKLTVCPQKIHQNDNLGTSDGAQKNSSRELVVYNA